MLQELIRHFAEPGLWDFSVPVRTFRAVHRLSQENLEKTLNVFRGTVNQWETGKKRPTMVECDFMARAFRIELPLFLYLAFKGSLDSAVPEDVKYLGLQLLYAVTRPLPLINPHAQDVDDSDILERRA